MIQYILECIAFQLVFLIIYDLFLKKETFFQWNRVYLIGTYVLSMFLPWVKIEALKTTVPEQYYVYPEFLWNTNDAVTTVVAAKNQGFTISWEAGILFGGMFLAALYFAIKLVQIQKLRAAGSIESFPNFTRIVVKNSELAFSFFKSIFLGDKVIARDHETIIKHEMVHIEQRHSWDLMFFEIMRIVAWFNPLVYVYQSRISELHEFIADAKVAKNNKKEQYEFLLSQVFQTQHISFINQFFKSSLIKKRIVMLQKSKSKRVWQLKYLLLVPIILGMLFYTSCVNENSSLTKQVMVVDDVNNLSSEEDQRLFDKLKQLSLTGEYWEYLLKDENTSIAYKQSDNGSFIKFDNNQTIDATMVIVSNSLSERELESNDSRTKHENVQIAQSFFDSYIQGVEERMNENNLSKAERYNELLAERSRLLKSANENNPIIVNLDEQIIALKRGLEAKKVKNHVIQQDSILVPFAVVDEVPIFPGCEDAENTRACFQKMMQKHIGQNFRYPEEAQEKGIQGRVSIMFTISKDGSIQNVKMRGPDKLLEDEAARIISKLPKMTPGKQDGEVVNVPFSIPITFKLQGSSDLKTETLENTIQVNEKEFKIKGENGLEPIYIVDGVETDNGVNQINPNSIESINVLKGESAKAVYGEEAKNGAVVITLKNEKNIIKKAAFKGMSVLAKAVNLDSGKRLYGSVTDSAKLPLPGVNILIEGTSKGAISDFDGNFTIEAKKGDVLVFQYIGLPSLKFEITDKNDYRVLVNE